MTNYIAYLPLMLIGIGSLATVKVPEGVSPLFFYGMSTLAAVALLATVSFFWWISDKFASRFSVHLLYLPGWIVAICMLTFAGIVLYNLEPYVPPTP